MTDTIKFLDKEYTKETLDGMSDEDLLELRNLVASNLGVASVKSFKDHATAVAQTWKALERFNESDGEEKPKAKKKPKEPKERKLAKSAEAKIIKRPSRSHFATIEKTGDHTGEEGRQHRWDNYKDGMTLADIIETEGTEPWDVYNWQKHGIMKVHEPTDEEYAERRAAWFKKHGRKDPEVEKAEKKAEAERKRAEAAAKKAAEADAS